MDLPSIDVAVDVFVVHTPSKKFLEYKAVWDACSKAGLQVPEEVSSYFGYQYPRSSEGLEQNIPIKKVTAPGDEGLLETLEFDMKDIPIGTAKLKIQVRYTG